MSKPTAYNVEVRNGGLFCFRILSFPPFVIPSVIYQPSLFAKLLQVALPTKDFASVY
jgi:hypothetical protein